MRNLRIKKKLDKAKAGIIEGSVLDPNGAVIPNATVTLIDEKTKSRWSTTTNDEGAFTLPRAASGSYTLEIASPGFKTYRLEDLAIGADENLVLESILAVDFDGTVTVGILMIETPQILTNGGTTTISGDVIRNLPRP
jgi:hypothetical protein